MFMCVLCAMENRLAVSVKEWDVKGNGGILLHRIDCKARHNHKTSLSF